MAPSQERGDKRRAAPSQEPFGLPAFDEAPPDLSAKWADLQSRMLSEEGILAACRSNDSNCSAVGRRLLNIIEMGRQRQGLARLGEINRAVNLSIKPLSDWKQYGMEDFWSAPLAMLSTGAGDCEDYAILKYLVLRAAGIERDDLRLVVVHDLRRKVGSCRTRCPLRRAVAAPGQSNANNDRCHGSAPVSSFRPGRSWCAGVCLRDLGPLNSVRSPLNLAANGHSKRRR